MHGTGRWTMYGLGRFLSVQEVQQGLWSNQQSTVHWSAQLFIDPARDSILSARLTRELARNSLSSKARNTLPV